MIVQRTSVFPAGRDTVFHKLRRLSTLQAVAAPYASFEPVGDGVGTWEVGGTSAYRFRLFGVIPFGTHTIHIVRFDPRHQQPGGKLRKDDDNRWTYDDK